jgi:asparagine synthase (glutamine-hydrolysing)
MMKNYVPQDIADGEKQGFSGPDGSWFKGDSIDYVRRLLYNRNARIYDYLDREAVQALVQEHLHGISNRRLLIWSLIYLENLMEIFTSQRNLFERSPATRSRSGARQVFVT